jgi:hypothetical protein
MVVGARALITFRRHLINPTMPAAISRCPMFVFADPSNIGFGRHYACTTCRRDPTSIGSPRAVPVPWHSTQFNSSSDKPAE